MSDQNVTESSREFASEAADHDFGSDFESGSGDDGGANGQPAPGMGQSKSSKRRRRKRKKLATGTVGAEAGSADTGVNGASSASAVTFDGGAGPFNPAGNFGSLVGNGHVPIVMQGESLALAASAPVAGSAAPSGSMQRRSNPNGQNGQNGGGNSSAGQNGKNGQAQGQPQSQAQGQAQSPGKRWKKKFRDRERRTGRDGSPMGEARPDGGGFGGERVAGAERSYERPHRREGGRPDNFGNLVSTQHRKTKTGGGKERGFVGPMDHSYREASPEFGEAPPSTIQLRGRRGHRQFGDNQPIDHNAPRAVPIAEDAQTHIYLFVEDLFITAKVQETARKLGVKVAFIKNEKEAIAELTKGEEQNRPSLIVFDLNNANAKPLTLIPKLKTKLKRSASIIGFLSSIQGDLKAKAVEVGCDTVMPKAAFSQNLPNLLRRYGAEEAEEVNFNY